MSDLESGGREGAETFFQMDHRRVCRVFPLPLDSHPAPEMSYMESYDAVVVDDGPRLGGRPILSATHLNLPLLVERRVVPQYASTDEMQFSIRQVLVAIVVLRESELDCGEQTCPSLGD